MTSTTLDQVQSFDRPESVNRNMPHKAYLTIHKIRSNPPFEFDVFSISEIGKIPAEPGVFCLAKPRFDKIPKILNDWLFLHVAEVNDLKKAAEDKTSQGRYDQDVKILFRTVNPEDLSEHGNLAFVLKQIMAWF